MENLKDVERKVVYPTKGPLKMDTCGFAIIYCATISTKLKCVVYYLSVPITCPKKGVINYKSTNGIFAFCKHLGNQPSTILGLME